MLTAIREGVREALRSVELPTGRVAIGVGSRGVAKISEIVAALVEALKEADLLSTNDYHALHDSYLFCTRVRLRLHLQSGRLSDSLPTDHDATVSLAASLGFERTGELREQYMRYTRRARRTFETLFYE